MNNSSENENGYSVHKYLKNLENRISQIETHLNIIPLTEDENNHLNTSSSAKVTQKDESLEFRIGQYWLPKVGIIVLAIGIIFLLTFPYENLSPITPSLFGYGLAAGILGLSYYWRESFSFISRYLLGGGLVLLYFSTLRLYFFSQQPVLTNLNIELVLLLFIVAVNLFISVRRKSVYLVGVNLTLGYITAIVSNQPYFIFISLVLFSAASVYYKLKYKWYYLIIINILLTYFTHFIWFINNPIMGNELQLVSTHEINLIFILIYAALFAGGNLFRPKELPEDDILIVSTIINCFGSFALFSLVTLTTVKTNQSFYFVFASLIFLLISIVFWRREKSKYSTFFYCILGFTTLSVALISGFAKPDFFIWLCWQSLLVAIAGIWFRSKIIISANIFIFILIFLSYLLYTNNIGLVSISFGLVALFSARIINWQTKRLEIKTELMRNLYLAAAFIAFPYTLYHSIPADYISLSWIGVALVYYLLSLTLNNKKYRWMALLTLLLSVLYIFIIGIIQFEPIYRIISFLVLGVVLLIISLVYTRIRTKSNTPNLKKS
jgi:uncharacterized membrane protein